MSYKRSERRDQENGKHGLKRHHFRLSPETLQIASLKNGGCDSVKGGSNLLLMALQLICIAYKSINQLLKEYFFCEDRIRSKIFGHFI